MDEDLQDRVATLEREVTSLWKELEGIDATVGGLNSVENHITEAPLRIFRQFLITLPTYAPDFPLDDFIRHVRKSELETLDLVLGDEPAEKALRHHLQRRIGEIIEKMLPSNGDNEDKDTP